jgi:hypothetical protein
MTRVVSGLKWARPIARPRVIPFTRPRGKKAAGLRYERALAQQFDRCVPGQWWEFQDENGHGYCQTDLVTSVTPGGTLVVLEAKYTWTLEGHHQLEMLYLPVVAWATKRRVLGVLVCKVLVPKMADFVTEVWGDLSGAIARADQGHRSVLHWDGKRPLFAAFGGRHRYSESPAHAGMVG